MTPLVKSHGKPLTCSYKLRSTLQSFPVRLTDLVSLTPFWDAQTYMSLLTALVRKIVMIHLASPFFLAGMLQKTGSPYGTSRPLYFVWQVRSYAVRPPVTTYRFLSQAA